ncbi:hypothetical protein SODALDRAFT_357565 [Sodiomyces alkalinus F11]|uniref:GPI-anchored cell wall organization protein Ecm33 n=1 Tax=Sodiomyces alkalinus (strain CBS 110278 / VKM F-3762 / F11) TaxID=1314773 RepID=A0A3N2Q428_SODAK|nr:hypothetical protein SODALDRAFT_357565 [Sodiomyces alkalinus F11]ROT41510.1 hypothetical protein SODALDRAFT_357565 [Sodiomyces alkalinus F11]
MSLAELRLSKAEDGASWGAAVAWNKYQISPEKNEKKIDIVFCLFFLPFSSVTASYSTYRIPQLQIVKRYVYHIPQDVDDRPETCLCHPFGPLNVLAASQNIQQHLPSQHHQAHTTADNINSASPPPHCCASPLPLKDKRHRAFDHFPPTNTTTTPSLSSESQKQIASVSRARVACLLSIIQPLAMHAMKLAPALVALGAHLVSAQSGICSTATYTITDAAQATNIPCRTMQGSIEVSSDLAGVVQLDGPETIRGDLIVNNVTQLVRLSSNTLAAIEGRFEMSGLTALSELQFANLATIGEIHWLHLPFLGEFSFGIAGVTNAKSVRISDTFLGSLDGLNLGTVDSLHINNNNRLVSYSTQLANVSTILEITSNNPNLNITLANLVWAEEIRIGNAASLEVPSLEVVNGSMYLDQNNFESFSAPNLTTADRGAISFTNNTQLTNISMPLLESIGGGLTILNNTALETITGFPNLEQVGGAVLFGGEFTEVELPALNDVKGAFDVVSTMDIQEVCEELGDLENSVVQGTFNCVGEEDDANNAESSDGNGGSGGSGGNNSDDDDSAGNLIRTDMSGLMAVAAVVGLAQLLL